jgi:hypothetical protein
MSKVQSKYMMRWKSWLWNWCSSFREIGLSLEEDQFESIDWWKTFGRDEIMVDDKRLIIHFEGW